MPSICRFDSSVSIISGAAMISTPEDPVGCWSTMVLVGAEVNKNYMMIGSIQRES
jgi:hypothetical protein